jgi:Zn-dependent protease with chaperone function
MKMSNFFLSLVFAISSNVAILADNHGVYYSELEAFKEASETKLMFDEDAHQGLAEIQRDMLVCQNLTSFQRFVRSAFLGLDVVIVTPETMPRLYEYIDGICKKAGIQTPTIFITRKDGFFNAAAQKLLMSSGGIIIGQKLMKEVSDDALEAIVAHEIGHIKHNHINKGLALFVAQIVACLALVKILDIQPPHPESFDNPHSFTIEIYKYQAKLFGLMHLLSYIPSLIINKRFEKEADAFAYEANGKGQGLIEMFELLIKKDELREEEFTTIYELLQKNKAFLTSNDYYGLLMRYYLARTGQSINNFYKKIYYETFVGAHPSPQARIAAVKEYLAQQA